MKASRPGFYVFSAPWETVGALMANVNQRAGYNLTLPANYHGPNFIYAISITPSGSASLVTYNSNLNPPATYPVLSPPPASALCNAQTPFSITVTGGQGGAAIPAGINTNETFTSSATPTRIPRPTGTTTTMSARDNGARWIFPTPCSAKVTVDQVYSNDPAQFGPGSVSASGAATWSTVAPPLTAVPYAIANNLPYNLVTSFDLNDPQVDEKTSAFFFFSGGKFSSQNVLLAWSFQFIQPTIDALLTSYNAAQQAPPASVWPATDYDTIWTVKLDAVGNLTVNNGMCEGHRVREAAGPAAAILRAAERSGTVANRECHPDVIGLAACSGSAALPRGFSAASTSAPVRVVPAFRPALGVDLQIEALASRVLRLIAPEYSPTNRGNRSHVPPGADELDSDECSFACGRIQQHPARGARNSWAAKLLLASVRPRP